MNGFQGMFPPKRGAGGSSPARSVAPGCRIAWNGTLARGQDIALMATPAPTNPACFAVTRCGFKEARRYMIEGCPFKGFSNTGGKKLARKNHTPAKNRSLGLRLWQHALVRHTQPQKSSRERQHGKNKHAAFRPNGGEKALNPSPCLSAPESTKEIRTQEGLGPGQQPGRREAALQLLVDPVPPMPLPLGSADRHFGVRHVLPQRHKECPGTFTGGKMRTRSEIWSTILEHHR